jgi:uncharacterized protein YbjT (DUF2867 family)
MSWKVLHSGRKTTMIAVFGATGQTGSEVTRQLAAQGVPTRALVHNLQKATALADLRVAVVPVDLAQPETLETALRGTERAYFVTSGEATRSSPNFYAAAKRAGVKHIVRLSGSFLVREPYGIRFDEWHQQAELMAELSSATLKRDRRVFHRFLTWLEVIEHRPPELVRASLPMSIRNGHPHRISN